MTTHADEIEEATDHAARKARVDALFGGTQMATSLATTGDEGLPQTTTGERAEAIGTPVPTGPPDVATGRR